MKHARFRSNQRPAPAKNVRAFAIYRRSLVGNVALAIEAELRSRGAVYGPDGQLAGRIWREERVDRILIVQQLEAGDSDAPQ